jgi:hypothetical protein
MLNDLSWRPSRWTVTLVTAAVVLTAIARHRGGRSGGRKLGHRRQRDEPEYGLKEITGTYNGDSSDVPEEGIE